MLSPLFRRMCLLLAISVVTATGSRAADTPVFLRFKVTQPAAGKMRVSIGGFRHRDPWQFQPLIVEAAAGEWSAWQDLSKWPWHDRMNRAGGIAEWPSLTLTVASLDAAVKVEGSAFEVQLADKADEASVVIPFKERSESATIGFLLPWPLRDNRAEFETGSQMAARHRQWAEAANGGKPVRPKDFTLITSLWGPYDPGLARQELATLGQLGFNVVSNTGTPLLREAGMRSYSHTWLYNPDPEAADKEWQREADAIKRAQQTPDGKWFYDNLTHWVVSDEIGVMDFRSTDSAKLNIAFRSYLRSQGVSDTDLGKPLFAVDYPAAAMYEKTLPREADLPTRRMMFYAAKFGQWWSAKQLRHSSDLVKATLPGIEIETLPTDHGFFNAWGAPYMGMSFRLLDLFELGAQRSVDQLSAEDWLGLNHMYGPGYTWSGGQSFGYFNALMRSAGQSRQLSPGEKPIMLRGLITVSDDNYLRLKAYSSLAQGAKSFFFWTYGPTYIGTENYWSDLRSEYDGIAKISRTLARSEETLMAAQPVRDPVAVLYSVSHDIWNSDDPAGFVEKRLLWHGLRHLQVQPDFVREEDLVAGRLNGYKALYIADWCVSRAASAAIGEWVKRGGVVYLSAGAATRDEFNEPYVPEFARTVWPDNAAQEFVKESHSYNERTNLPGIKPMTKVHVKLGATEFDLPVIGCRLNLRGDVAAPLATFEDGSAAGASVAFGAGRVNAFGFMPMLAYGQLAGFKAITLEEKWPAEPRALLQLPLSQAKVVPVAGTNTPVVESSLLTGSKGSALVLANYTYQPVANLVVELKTKERFRRAVSTEGVAIKMTPAPGGVRLELPLAWTDLILLEK